MEDLMINRAMKDWEEASADPKQRELYFDRKKAILDELAAVESARAEGKAEGRAEDICQFLEVRFGTASQFFQDTVRMITDLNTLNRITPRIFAINHLDEAKALSLLLLRIGKHVLHSFSFDGKTHISLNGLGQIVVWFASENISNIPEAAEFDGISGQLSLLFKGNNKITLFKLPEEWQAMVSTECWLRVVCKVHNISVKFKEDTYFDKSIPLNLSFQGDAKPEFAPNAAAEYENRKLKIKGEKAVGILKIINIIEEEIDRFEEMVKLFGNDTVALRASEQAGLEKILLCAREALIIQ